MQRGLRFLAGLVVCSAACSSDGPGADPDANGDGGNGDGTVSTVDPEWPPDEALPAAFDFPPYLNLMDATTVVVSWRTGASTTGVVRFGTTPALGQQLASSTAQNLHHVTLSGLDAGAAYYYEVEIDGASATRKGVFVLPGRSQWRFMHSGEFHAPSESNNVAKFAAAIREFRPHVLVESGDMADDGNDLGDWRSYLRTSAPWISNTLLLPAHSNHVNGDGGNANLKDLFVIPNNERWYVTRFSQIEFFTLDSSRSDNDDVMSAEIPWLATEAAKAHDGTDDPTFVVGLWHHPACSSQYYTRGGDRDWVHQNIVATFRTAGGIDLILAAHDKYYERSMITGGIHHLITNIGNTSPEIPGNNHPDCTVVKTDRDTKSTAFFTVDGNKLDGRVVNETGTEIDALSIVK